MNRTRNLGTLHKRKVKIINRSMKTRQDNKKTKWERGIPKEKWDHQTFQVLLLLELFEAISTQMGKKAYLACRNNERFHYMG